MESNILTNESEDLKPHANMREPILEFDFPGIKIGIAQYPEGPTGCTVIKFDPTSKKKHRGARFYADVRGGSPIVKLHELGWADAICLAGGSILGLDASNGVMFELLAEQNYELDWLTVPAVAGAIIWDFHVRDNTLYPDKKLGRLAAQNVKEGKFPMGRQGAGSTARVGAGILSQTRGAMDAQIKLFEISGQGAHFDEVKGTKIFACVVLNALGAIKNKKGEIIKGHIDSKTKKRLSMIEQVDILEKQLKNKNPLDKREAKNTTLTVVVTNQALTDRELKQVARQVHSSMSKMIDPFHTMNDGDALFFVTTDEITNESVPTSALGSFATDIVWDAVLNCFE